MVYSQQTGIILNNELADFCMKQSDRTISPGERLFGLLPRLPSRSAGSAMAMIKVYPASGFSKQESDRQETGICSSGERFSAFLPLSWETRPLQTFCLGACFTFCPLAKLRWQEPLQPRAFNSAGENNARSQSHWRKPCLKGDFAQHSETY